MSVQSRIREFIGFKHLSTTAFCDSIGVSNSYVSSMRRSIAPDKIRGIASVYPELNMDWLLYGEGQMLKPMAGLSASQSTAGVSSEAEKWRLEVVALQQALSDCRQSVSDLQLKNEKLIEDAAVLRYRLKEAQSLGGVTPLSSTG